jgi:hypothetical protein
MLEQQEGRPFVVSQACPIACTNLQFHATLPKMCIRMRLSGIVLQYCVCARSLTLPSLVNLINR